jgi:hypothetical protein
MLFFYNLKRSEKFRKLGVTVKTPEKTNDLKTNLLRIIKCVFNS